MTNKKTNLELAIKELQPYIPVNGRHALLKTIINRSEGDLLNNLESKNENDEGLIIAFQDVIDGGLFTHELCESLSGLTSGASNNQPADISALRKKIERTIRITLPDDASYNDYMKDNIPAPFLNDEHAYDKEKNKQLSLEISGRSLIEGVSCNSNSFKNPQKTDTSITAIEILNSKIGLTVRDTDAVSVFLSLIPTIELSKCVPYLSVNFWNPDLPSVGNISGEETLEGLSLSMFLRGKGANVSEIKSSLENSSLRKKIDGISDSTGFSGMELFTSPQTLVPDSNSLALSERKNIPAVLDRFRPFMSIAGLNISVAPSNGFMSFKTATMEFVLHDRSRLHEISSFIRPQLFGKTELIIEYGWANQEGERPDNRNPFAKMLNSLRVKEKYGISNSSFRFDNSGQVNITLNLFTKGITQLQSIPVGLLNTNDKQHEFLDLFNKLSEKIQELSKAPRFQKIFDETFISAFSSESRLLSLDKKELAELKKTLKPDKESGVTPELIEKLNKLLSSDLKSFQESIDEAVKNEIAGFISGTEIFPCVKDQLQGSRIVTFPAKTNKSKQNELEQEKQIREEIQRNQAGNSLSPQQETKNDRKRKIRLRINEITREIKSDDVLGFDPDNENLRKLITLDKSTFMITYERGLQFALFVDGQNKKKQIDTYNRDLSRHDRLRVLYFERKDLQNQLKEVDDNSFITPTRIEGQVKSDRQKAIDSLRSKGVRFQRFNPVGGTINDSVSFGRIMMSFVGKPLAKSNAFDEIQFMFHSFNEKATFMRGMSIAKFPISHKDFSEQLANLLKKNPKLDIQQFIGFVLSEYVNNPASKPYGFTSLYNRDTETGRWERKEAETEKERKQNADKEDEIIKSAGINDGKFFVPRVQMVPECVPHVKDPTKTILRLHFIDQRATTFSSYFELLKSIRQGDISTIGLENEPNHPMFPEAPELREDYIKQKQDEALNIIRSKLVPIQKQTQQSDQSEDADIGIDIGEILEAKTITQTKRVISQGVPTILYGASAGAIKNIGLSSQNDPKLSTVNMLRENREDPATPELNRNRGLPIQIHPVECSIEMLGCPIIDRMQHYFIDFGTGTTADNMYVVNSVDHKIGPGEFSTSVKLVYLESFMSYQSPKKKLVVSKTLLERLRQNN